MSADAIITRAVLDDSGELKDIVVRDGRIAGIHRAASEAAPSGEGRGESGPPVIDAGGKLMLPPYVDPHLHLDYAYTAHHPELANGTGTLFEAIGKWGEVKKGFTYDGIRERARRAVEEEASHGVQHIRTHVDVTDPDLTALQAILDLREEVKHLVDIQIVAFPQEGMYAYPGGRDLVEEALTQGADVVGGIPHYEFAREFGERSIHDIVDLAVKHGKPIDVHCDETDDDRSRFLELLAALAHREGIGDRTTASHTCSLGSANPAYAFKLLPFLARTGISLIACPTENIHLQGRQDAGPVRRGMTPVAKLREAGVRVCFAQDSIADPWYPLGNGNMMNILDAGVHYGHLAALDAAPLFDLVATASAGTIGLEDYGLHEGAPANLMVLDAGSHYEALRNRAGVTLSMRAGEVLFTRPSSTPEWRCTP
ncbi:amidohydrolase family protein [Corynebacterium sp. 335C]